MANTYNYDSGTCPTIYFAKIPDFKELCTLSLQVCPDSPGISNIAQFGSQPQIIKCRELIFTEPCVLASPSLQEQGLIFVIIQQSFWKTGKLQKRCQKSGLKISKPTRVIPAVFQACLSYTLKAKLAPLWNKAGDVYVKGRDFITCSTKAYAVGVDINVTDAEICIALKPAVLKLSQSDLRDFEIAPGVLEHFYSDNQHSIPEYAIEDKWCHILPSLKKGKVVSITHQIPPVSPFKTYKDIRRYWKNAYGYRLPESDVGVVYYNVYFPAIGHTLFTYPDFCVLKREPIRLPRVDPATIIPSFLTDVGTKLPKICGFPFQVNPKAQYTTTGLYQASIQNNSLSRLTLSAAPQAYPRPHVPLRQVPIYSPSQGRQAIPLNNGGDQHQRSTMPKRALAKAFDAAFHQAGNTGTQQTFQSQPTRTVTPQAGGVHQGPIGYQDNVYSQIRHPAHMVSPHAGSACNSPRPMGHMGGSVYPQSHHTLPVTPQAGHNGSSVYPQQSQQTLPITPLAGSTCPSPQSMGHVGSSVYPQSQQTLPITPQAGSTCPSPQSTGHVGSSVYPQSQQTLPVTPQAGSVLLSPRPMGYQSNAQSQLTHSSAGTQQTGMCPSPHQMGYLAQNANAAIPQRMTSPAVSLSQQADMPPSSPCAGTQHAIAHHSPLMTNSNTQSAAQITSAKHMSQYQVLQSPQSIRQNHSSHILSPQSVPQHPSIMMSPQSIQQRHQSPMPYPQHQRILPKPQHQMAYTNMAQNSFPSPTPQPRMLTPITQQDQQAPPRLIPSFRPHKPRNLSSQSHTMAPQPAKVIPVFKPAVARTPTLTYSAKVHLNFDKEPSDIQQPGSSVILQAARQAIVKPTFGGKAVAPVLKSNQSAASNAPVKTAKRKAQSDDNAAAKKPRAKPKVQEGIDMQALLVNDQLSKVNTVTLVTWLKDKNIKVKSREKKADLVNKVMDYINAKTKEN